MQLSHQEEQVLSEVIQRLQVEAPNLYQIIPMKYRMLDFPSLHAIRQYLFGAALIDDQIPHEKEAAARLLLRLGCFGLGGMCYVLEKLATDPNDSVRLLGFACMSDSVLIGSADVVPILKEGMNDANPTIRQFAIRTWRAVGPDLASGNVFGISGCLDDIEPEVRHESLSILKWLGPEAVDASSAVIRVMLTDGEQTNRAAAATTLMEIDPSLERAVNSLVAAINDEASKATTLTKLRTIGPPATPLRHKFEQALAAREAKQKIVEDKVNADAGNKKRRSGRVPFDKSTKPRDRLKYQIYQRIQREREAGLRPAEILENLKADKDFMAQVKDATLKFDEKLIKAAFSYFHQRGKN